jgi:hypothetical protein
MSGRFRRLLGVAVATVAMLGAVRAQDLEPERIATPVGVAIWCGDAAVAYNVEAWRGARADTGTFVKSLDTGETRRVSLVPDVPLACSPDGRFLVYAAPQQPAQTRLRDLVSDVDQPLGSQVHSYRWAAHGLALAALPRSKSRTPARLTPPTRIDGVLVSLDGATEIVWAVDRLVALHGGSRVALADDARPTPHWQSYALPVQRVANLRADRIGHLYVSAAATVGSTARSLLRCVADAPGTCAPLLLDYAPAFGFDVMPDGSLVFLADREHTCVVVLDVRSGRHGCRLTGRWSVLGVSGDGRRLLLADHEGLLAVAPITGALLSPRPR